MTRNKTQIITSNGSADLIFRDPETFKPIRTIAVHDGPMLIDQLNELEFVKGEIYQISGIPTASPAFRRPMER